MVSAKSFSQKNAWTYPNAHDIRIGSNDITGAASIYGRWLCYGNKFSQEREKEMDENKGQERSKDSGNEERTQFCSAFFSG